MDSKKDSTSGLHYASRLFPGPSLPPKPHRTKEKENETLLNPNKKKKNPTAIAGIPELWIYTEMLIQRLLESKEGF